MQVQMLIHIGGTRNGQEWPPADGFVDVPDHEAADLIAAGYAKAVTDEDAPDPTDTGPGEGDEASTEDSDAVPADEPDEAPEPEVTEPKKRGAVTKAAPRA